MKLLHGYFLENGILLPVSEFRENTGIEIYEVIRVIDTVPLFLEDHLKRLFHSAWLLHLEIPLTGACLQDWIEQLIRQNGVIEGNIRFSYCFRPAGKFQTYFIPHRYPEKHQVISGISCGLLSANRADPNVKAVQSEIRANADRLICEQGFYEVLLVDDENRITEGSRSNVFFIRSNELVTAGDDAVLPGITRKKVIELAEDTDCIVHFESFPLHELNQAEAVFITGTSPRILPVRRVGDYSFRTDHPLVMKLIAAYDAMIADYIQVYKGARP